MKNIKTWIKSLFFALAVLLLVPAFSRTAYADTEDYTYSITENGIIITGCNGEYSYLTIPQEIGGQAVVQISQDAFSSTTDLTSIVIPESVAYIGDNAFSNCPNLTKVRFTGNAPAVGENTFSNCSPDLRIYYTSGKIGFENSWNGFTAKAYIPVTGITLDKTSVNLLIGDNFSIQPLIVPAEAVNKNISFTSSNPNIAAVDETGNLIAVSEGNAVITVTAEDGGFTAACSVTVYHLPAVPGDEFAVPLYYDENIIHWSVIPDADGYELYRSDTVNGEYIRIAAVQTTDYMDQGLKTGTVYYYKVRAYETVSDTTVYSDYTPVISVKTLDKSIGSTLFLYMSDYNNRNSVVRRAVELHYGDPRNTCALTVSEALRRINMSIPTSTCRTNQVEDQLIARGWKREMNLKLLQPGDICFTTDAYGNPLGGHSTHTFIFMGWANKDKTLMNICDNQVGTYGSVLHKRTIFSSNITDATAFFYHADIPDVSSILKIPSTVKVNPISYNKVKISWKAANSAYGYTIYRAASRNGTYVRIAATRNTVFVDAAVTTGKTYYYRVRAYNNIGTSQIYGNYSDRYAVTPSLSAPSALAKLVYSNKARLSWRGVSGASGYQIFRSTKQNGTYTRVGSTSHTTYINQGLIRGKNYYYRVRAYRYTGKTIIYSKYSY